MLGTFVVWFLAWPRLAQDLDQRNQAMHLLAWTALSQQPTKAQPTPSGQIIELRTIWPLSSMYYAELRKVAERLTPATAKGPQIVRIEIFAITARQASSNPFINIPYEQYLVRELYLRDGSSVREVFFRGCGGGPSSDFIRQLDFCSAIRSQFEGPFRWREIRETLRSREKLEGAISPHELEPLSPMVTSYLSDTLTPIHKILGFELSAGLFNCSIGIALGLLALNLLPSLFLSREALLSKEPDSLILFRPSGIVGAISEPLLLILTVAWALMPLYVLYLQRRVLGEYGVNLTVAESYMQRIGTALLIVALVISFAAVMKLHRCRKT